MISSIISRLVILLFGTLYPAYASYKAVKTKNVKEYVKWMMYWIVFALFTSAETFTDVFLSWFPFYYEIKIVIVLWLLSPATRGSSILYRKFVHPMLSKREQDIDEYISKAKEQSYKQVLDFGQKGVTVLMQTAIKGGGGIVNQLRKSYSLTDLSEPTFDNKDEIDNNGALSRLHKRKNHSSSIYFQEIEVRNRDTPCLIEDVSSGYSSGEVLTNVPSSTSSQNVRIQGRAPVSSALARSKSTRVTRSTSASKKSSDSEVSDDGDNEIFDTNIIFLNGQRQRLNKIEMSESSSEEFYESMDKLHENVNKSCPNILTACLDEQETMKGVKRGGKYNKKMAPPPPPLSSSSSSGNTVKGILVLKPGVIRTTSGNNEKRDIFFEMPKMKRKNSTASKKIAFNACSRVGLITKNIAEKALLFPSLNGKDILHNQFSRSEINLNNSLISNHKRIKINKLNFDIRSKMFNNQT